MLGVDYKYAVYADALGSSTRTLSMCADRLHTCTCTWFPWAHAFVRTLIRFYVYACVQLFVGLLFTFIYLSIFVHILRQHEPQDSENNGAVRRLRFIAAFKKYWGLRPRFRECPS